MAESYYYCREHDGSGWSVRGPDGFELKMPPSQPLDKSVAYIISRLLNGNYHDASLMLVGLLSLKR